MKENFLEICVDLMYEKEAIDCIKEYFCSSKIHTIYFLNAHCFNICQKNTQYRKALNNASLLLIDGIGIKLGMKICKMPEPQNMNGTDFIPKVIDLANNLNKKIYLLGAKYGVVDKAEEIIKQRYPGCKIVGKRHGYFSDKDDGEIIDDIIKKETDLLIVGMGVPKQELWIERNKKKLESVQVVIAGGAILDFISGNVKRAPKFMRQLNLEWLYRLYKEPIRLFKRYMIGNLLFFYYVRLRKKNII
ncbi:WecB/TagA/CpsF family glycosyltransferase [uncultured Clostridium sp.]|uniref:WecB/TagA/CpsF family glycosyltransferase n=1 Tax=uncultured Clostridium sp. TaxID=59620 RepID=UPI0025E1C027|nr:WecB/TagA/CpsF family glycosyltransferase [uncultured Clostridium sp.]